MLVNLHSKLSQNYYCIVTLQDNLLFMLYLDCLQFATFVVKKKRVQIIYLYTNVFILEKKKCYCQKLIITIIIVFVITN